MVERILWKLVHAPDMLTNAHASLSESFSPPRVSDFSCSARFLFNVELLACRTNMMGEVF